MIKLKALRWEAYPRLCEWSQRWMVPGPLGRPDQGPGQYSLIKTYFPILFIQPSAIQVLMSRMCPQGCCFSFCCCCSAAKLYPSFGDPMHCNMPVSVLHYHPEFAQSHVHCVGDAFHLLLASSPFAFIILILYQHEQTTPRVRC